MAAEIPDTMYAWRKHKGNPEPVRLRILEILAHVPNNNQTSLGFGGSSSPGNTPDGRAMQNDRRGWYGQLAPGIIL